MRLLNPDQLLAFGRIVELGSFSAAADALGLTQPAVSQQLLALERRLQVRLVERVGRRATPTAAGAALQLHVGRITTALADAEAAVVATRDGDGGRVHLGAGATACIHLLPPLLKRLKRSRPNLAVVVTTGNTADIVGRVEANTLDAALVTLPVASRSVAVTPVVTDRYVAIGPGGSAGAHRMATPRRLAGEPLILFESGANTRALVDRWFARAGIAVQPVMELGSVEAIKELVGAGMGWSVLPEMSLPTRRRAGLDVLPLAPSLARTLAWIVRRDKPLTRALQQVQQALLSLRTAALPPEPGART